MEDPSANTIPRDPSPTGLGGLRICSFESRKGSEMQSLIERQGGLARIVPSMREVPLEENPAAIAFGQRLLAGGIDVVIFLTGVGARTLDEVLAAQIGHDAFVGGLKSVQVVVRGPKPAAVLREWGVRIDLQVPEPNTWRDLLAAIEPALNLQGRVVAVQEYGVTNPDLSLGLETRGAVVLPVPVYRWELPCDPEPLRQAVRDTCVNAIDVLLFTSAQQLRNVLTVATELRMEHEWLVAANRCAVGSIGPTATETLIAGGLPPDFEPEHPKMGHLVLAAGRQAWAALKRKRMTSAG